MLEVVIPPSGVVGIGSTVKMSSLDSTRHYDHSKSGEVSGRKKEQTHSRHKGGHKERHLSGRTTSSANDSTLQSGRGEKGVSSNTRPHPQAELREGSKHASNHLHNHTPSRSGDRKRKHNEDEEEQDIWTEHKSSSGRIYYYNKRLDKSQWEKPLKGNLKKLKSEPQTPKSSLPQTGSHSSSKSHSHTSKRSHVGSSHHGGSHHHSSSERRSTHHSSLRKAEKKSSVTTTPTSTHQKSGVLSVTSPPTPLSSSGLIIVSPTGQHISSSASQTPTQIVNHSSRHFLHQYNTPESPLVNSQVVIGAPYIMDQSSVPSTPLQPVITYGGNMIGTPVTPGAEGSGLHPLQRALILQNQYSQVYTPTQPPVTPPFHMVHVSHSQSAPVTPINSNMSQFPTQYTETVPLMSQKFQSPMSRLGRWTGNGTGDEVEFPDPNSLKPLPQLPAGDLFNRVLADVLWTSQYEMTQKQIDHAHLESLSRTTVDYGYHCGQLARSLLSLECCRIKTVSRTIRLTDLNKLKEVIEKR